MSNWQLFSDSTWKFSETFVIITFFFYIDDIYNYQTDFVIYVLGAHKRGYEIDESHEE